MSNKMMPEERFLKFQQEAEKILQEHLGEHRTVQGVLNNNWVFLTNDGKEPYMVKFIPEDEKKRLYAEVALYQFISEKTTLPVPKIIKVVELSAGAYLLREVIEGQTLAQELEEQMPTQRQKLFYQAGEYLAQLHQFEFPTKGVFGPKMEIEPLDAFSANEYQQMLKPLYEHGVMDDSEYQEWLQVDVDYYFDRLPYVLCHCDYSLNNLIARDGEIVAVIDLEWAMAAPFMDDLASFDLFAEINGYGEYRESFYQGYQSVRQLPAYYFDHLRFHKFYRVLTMLSYQIQVTDERFDGEFHDTLRKMFAEYLQGGCDFVRK